MVQYPAQSVNCFPTGFSKCYNQISIILQRYQETESLMKAIDWWRALGTDWDGLKQIETVGNAVNSDCARRNGGQPSRRERAAAGGPVGRLRTERAGACADQYLKQQVYNTIYFNTFIKQFFNIRIPSISFSVFLQISWAYSRYLLTECNTPSPTCAFCNNFLFSCVDTFGFAIFLTVSW